MTDRNLLVGMIAAQTGRLSPAQIQAAWSDWIKTGKTDFAAWLKEEGRLSPGDVEAVESLIGDQDRTASQIESMAGREAPRFSEGDLTSFLDVLEHAQQGGRQANSDSDEVTLDSDDIEPDKAPGDADLIEAEPDETPAPPQAEPPAETRARYSLEKLHAEGGLGRVWLARDDQLNRLVALKELKPGHAENRQVRGRFVKEAQVTGQLEHPSIVPVYELSHCSERGEPFYTMRFVRGPTLRDAIAEYHARRKAGEEDPLQWPRLLNAFVSVCQAIGYAHSRGVVHRDLKPENVLLGDFGEVLVLDWGLARVAGEKHAAADEAGVAVSDDGHTEATKQGRILGTPAYMSPEQAQGQLDQIDARTDIYGLGAILFEILTGEPPHSGKSTADLLISIIEGPAPQSRERDPAISAALDAICARAMAREPEDRYATAPELARDVQRWLADEPVLAYRETLPQRLARWSRRHRTWTKAIAAALVLVTFISLLAVVFVNTARHAERYQRRVAERARKEEARQRQAAQAARNKAEAERRRAEDLAEENNSQLVRWHEGNGTRLIEQGDLSGGLLWFTEGLRVHRGNHAREGRLRRQVATVLRHCPRLLQVWFHDAAVEARFSPDGTRVLTFGDDRTARVWDVSTGQAVTQPLKVFAAGPQSRLNDAVFSPDGKLVLAITERAGLWVWDSATGEQIAGPFSSETTHAQFSPDSRHVVAYTPGESARVWEARTGLPVTPVLTHEDRFHSDPGIVQAEFHPASDRLLTLGRNGTLRIWEIATGKPLPLPLIHETPLTHGTFGPAGHTIVAAERNGTLRIWDAVTGKLQVQPFRALGPITQLAFGDDGQLLVAASEGGVIQVWDTATGQQVAKPFAHKAQPLEHLILGPDNERLLAASEHGIVRIWQFYRGEQVEATSRARAPIVQLGFGPAGRLVIAGLEDGTTQVWDARTGQPSFPPLVHGGRTTAAHFGQDGQTILTSGTDGVAKLWSIATKEFVQHPVAMGHTFAEFGPDHTRVLSANASSQARVWSLETGKSITRTLPHQEEIRSAALARQGDIAATGDERGNVYVWEAHTGDRLWGPLEHAGAVSQLAFSNDSRLLVAVTRGEVKVWDMIIGTQQTAALEHPADVVRTQFSAKNQFLLTLTSLPEAQPRVTFGDLISPAGGTYEARLWNLKTGKQATLVGQNRTLRVMDACFSPHGRWLLTIANDGTASVWDVPGGTSTVLSGEGRQRIISGTFSPDERLVITGTEGPHGKEGAAQVWDCATGKAASKAMKHAAPVTGVVCSPDGELLLTKTANDTLRLWKARTGESLTPPQKPQGELIHVAFSPGSRFFLTETLEHTAREAEIFAHFVRVWDAGTGEPVSPRLRFSAPVHRKPCASFVAGVRHVAIRSVDGVKLWKIGPEPIPADDLQKLSQCLAGRRLDESGSMIKLETDAFRQRWKDVRRNTDNPLAGDGPGEPRRWYAREAMTAEAAEQWYGAAFYLSRLLQHQGDDWGLHARRAHAYAEQRKWSEAERDFQKSMDLGGRDCLLWHRRQANRCFERGHWETVIWYLDRVIVHLPQEVDLYVQRGDARAELGDWEETIADYLKAVELSSQPAYLRSLAILSLWKSDPWTFRMICQEMMKQSAEALHDENAHVVIATCTLSAKALDDFGSAAALAEQHALGKSDALHDQMAYAFACFRQKRYEEAITRIQDVDSQHPLAGLLRAMTHHQLENGKEARRWLKRVENQLQQQARSAERVPWQERLTQQILLDEARLLIRGTATANRPADELPQ